MTRLEIRVATISFWGCPVFRISESSTYFFSISARTVQMYVRKIFNFSLFYTNCFTNKVKLELIQINWFCYIFFINYVAQYSQAWKSLWIRCPVYNTTCFQFVIPALLIIRSDISSFSFERASMLLFVLQSVDSLQTDTTSFCWLNLLSQRSYILRFYIFYRLLFNGDQYPLNWSRICLFCFTNWKKIYRKCYL